MGLVTAVTAGSLFCAALQCGQSWSCHGDKGWFCLAEACGDTILL